MGYGTVLRVSRGSLAEELGLLPGDKIVSMNDQPLRDIIDLSFAMAEEDIDMLVEHADGKDCALAASKGRRRWRTRANKNHAAADVGAER